MAQPWSCIFVFDSLLPFFVIGFANLSLQSNLNYIPTTPLAVFLLHKDILSCKAHKTMLRFINTVEYWSQFTLTVHIKIEQTIANCYNR
jgi:hypothetical protein